MVQKRNIFKFIEILKAIQLDYNKFNVLSEIHSRIETLDIDLLIKYIENSDAEMQLKKKLVSLVNIYYDLIDKQINDYEDENAKNYLSILKKNALIIFENHYLSLLKLCEDK